MNKNTIASIFITAAIISAFNFLPGVSAVLHFDEQEATVRAIQKVSPAVVDINVTERRTLHTTDLQTGQVSDKTTDVFDGSGTGFIISADGLIITNKHVIEVSTATDTAYRVVLSSGKKYYAQLIGKDPLNDLALLKIFDKNLPYVELGDSDKLPVGASVIAIGNALGVYQNSVTKGIVSGFNRNIVASDSFGTPESLGNVMQTDAQINPGNSGGPLIDLQGKVVGVNVAVDTTAQGINFVIPINDVKPVIKTALQIGRIVRPRLGIRYITLNDDLSLKYALDLSQGAWIHSTDDSPAVLANTPAQQAGLVDGDIVTEVNGKKLDQKLTLVRVAQVYSPGQVLQLKIYRNKKYITKNITLDEYPAQ